MVKETQLTQLTKLHNTPLKKKEYIWQLEQRNYDHNA